MWIMSLCGKDKVEYDENLKKFPQADKKYGITFIDDKGIFSTTVIQLLRF